MLMKCIKESNFLLVSKWFAVLLGSSLALLVLFFGQTAFAQSPDQVVNCNSANCSRSYSNYNGKVTLACGTHNGTVNASLQMNGRTYTNNLSCTRYCRDANANNYRNVASYPGITNNALCTYTSYCRDTRATNYRAAASYPGVTDNSLCVYPGQCRDSNATNYANPSTVPGPMDNNQCIYPPAVSIGSRTTSQTTWSTASSRTIAYGDLLDIRVQTSNVTSCTKQGFSLSGTNGTATNVPRPAGGSNSTYSVSCTGPGGNLSDTVVVTRASQPPTAMIRYRIAPDLVWQTGASAVIDFDETVAVNWVSQNATQCTGTNFSTGNATYGTVNLTPPAGGASTSYTLRCTGPGGAVTDVFTLTRRGAPNLTTPNVSSLNPSTTFNSTTGTYNSAQISYNVQNNGASPTNQFQNRFQFDYLSNGSFDSTSNSVVANLIAGATSANETVTLTNVPFGIHQVHVLADANNQVVESDETDNLRTLTITLPPPNPGFDTSATIGIWPQDRIVRSGDRTTINWNTGVTYPMSCRVEGLGVNVTFNPSVDGPTGNAETGAITATQEYTLTCTEPITGTVFRESARVETTGRVEEI